MLLHTVWLILFGVLAWETTFSFVEILQRPIRNFHFKVFRANSRNKMDHTMWKSRKNRGFGVRNFMHFCFKPLVPLERCVLVYTLQICVICVEILLFWNHFTLPPTQCPTAFSPIFSHEFNDSNVCAWKTHLLPELESCSMNWISKHPLW